MLSSGERACHFCDHPEISSQAESPASRQGNLALRSSGEEEWRGALHTLVTEFGGATLGSTIEGCWDDKGRMHCEPVLPVTISFAPERLKRFQQLFRDVGRQSGQESISTRFEEPRIELTDVTSGV